MLLRTSALRPTAGALAQGTTVDRDDIAGLGAAHNNRPGYRRQGWPSRAGVDGVGTAPMSSTSSKAPRPSPANSWRIDGHRPRELRGSTRRRQPSGTRVSLDRPKGLD